MKQSTGNLFRRPLPCFLLSFALFAYPRIADAQTGTFSATGSMGTARYQGVFFGGTLLPNGRVLVAGGAGNPLFTSLASAELYDPMAGTFSATGSMTTPRVAYAATLLRNGKVLVAGGFNGPVPLASTELYDPTTGTFSATGSMTTPRYDHTATLLPTGKVLIAGGCGNSGGCLDLASAELYDPTTGTFSTTGSMITPRRVHLATPLSNGRVLVTGGVNTYCSCVLADAELYDPATGTFSATSSMTTARFDDTATLLPNGQVLVAGGCGGYFSCLFLASAELYDPTTGAFSATGSMATARETHTGTLLPNGKVLVAAGGNASGALASAELYDPTTGAFSATGSIITPRFYPLATLLPNGKVLVAGGSNANVALANAELYSSFPTDKDQCKNNGWMTLSGADGRPFKNQGDCIQFVNTGK